MKKYPSPQRMAVALSKLDIGERYVADLLEASTLRAFPATKSPTDARLRKSKYVPTGDERLALKQLAHGSDARQDRVCRLNGQAMTERYFERNPRSRYCARRPGPAEVFLFHFEALEQCVARDGLPSTFIVVSERGRPWYERVAVWCPSPGWLLQQLQNDRAKGRLLDACDKARVGTPFTWAYPWISIEAGWTGFGIVEAAR